MSLSLHGIKKTYHFHGQDLLILNDLNLEVGQGRTVAILGPSGSGKTTLLSVLAGLENPDSGEVVICQNKIFQSNEEERTKFRARNVGIVFQQFHLIPHLTAVENVTLPLEIMGRKQGSEEKAVELLRAVGLGERLSHRPGELSGGECQRVAIARSLISDPKLLLADEPSGNLDTKTGHEVMDLFFSMARAQSITTVLVTHNESLVGLCDEAYRLQEGKLVKI